MEYKVWYNYLLFKLGKRDVLPRKIINNIIVRDNNEKLVFVDESRFYFDDRIEKPVVLRKTVYDKICLLDKWVRKDGYRVKLFDAYRSLESQKRSWNRRIEESKKLYPNVSEDEIIRLTSLKVANPTKGIGGHQTGGAIDITLTDEYGCDLDMGSKYAEHIPQTRTNSKELSETQKKNRYYLLEKMDKLDFVNFPIEWWHFCYGDQMWAAYKGKRTCFYGYIELKKENKIKKKCM